MEQILTDFDALCFQSGLENQELAILLGTTSAVVKDWRRGKLNIPHGVIGDMVQILEEIAYWQAAIKSSPIYPHEIIFKIALANVEKDGIVTTSQRNSPL